MSCYRAFLLAEDVPWLKAGAVQIHFRYLHVLQDVIIKVSFIRSLAPSFLIPLGRYLSGNCTRLDRCLEWLILAKLLLRSGIPPPPFYFFIFFIRCRVTCARPPTPLSVHSGNKLGSSLSTSPFQMRSGGQMTRCDLILSHLLGSGAKSILPPLTSWWGKSSCPSAPIHFPHQTGYWGIASSS